MEDAGICIRPVHTEEELMDEGAALHHCVGGYGETVASGRSSIFFIRRADAPEKPWYTLQVELKTLKEIQNHVKHATAPYKYPRVVEFVKELPKTNSGKIMRTAIRAADMQKLQNEGK